MSTQNNPDEQRNSDLRAVVVAYGNKQATADGPTQLDNAHFMRIANSDIKDRHGTP
jgi:hypothetical protein